MKIQKLSMTAFGSYVNKTELDFKDLQNGVYLITGGTGAGKTTIFDAIFFALFGCGSGGDRTAKMLHSRNLPEGKQQDTEVELIFEQSGKLYRVLRRIHFKKKQKQENTYEFDKVECSFFEDVRWENGQWSTDIPIVSISAKDEKKGDEPTRIEKVIGLRANQFKQIVMLAQGKFKQFLEAGSDAREGILKDVFDVKKAEKIQELLKSASEMAGKSRLKGLPDLDSRVKHMPGGNMTPDEIAAIKPRKENLKKGKEPEVVGKKDDPETVEIIPLSEENIAARAAAIRAFVTRERELVVQAEGNAGTADTNRDNAFAEYQDGKVHNQNVGDLENKKNVRSELERRRPEMEKINRLLESWKTLKPVREAEMKLRNLEEQVEGAEECWNSLDAEKTKIENEIEKILGELSILSEEQAAEKVAELEREAIDNTRDEEARKNRFEGIVLKCGKIQKAYEKLLEQQKSLQRASEQRDRSKKNSTCLLDRYLQSQAGIMAERLKTDIAERGVGRCPVCGVMHDKTSSIDGTDFAQLAEDAPTWNDVEKAKTQCDEDQAEFNRLDTDVRTQVAVLEQRKTTELLPELVTIPGCENWQWDELCDNKRVEGMRQELERRVNGARTEVKRVAELKHRYDSSCNRKRENNGALKKSGENLEDLRSRCAKARTDYEASWSANYDREEDYLSSWGVFKSDGPQDQDPDTWANTKTREYTEWDLGIRHIAREINDLASKVADKPKVNLEELNTKWKKLRELAKNERERCTKLKTEHSNNGTLLRDLESYSRKLAKTQDQYRRLEELNQIVNAEKGAGERIKFVSYMLRQTLAEVLERANERMEKMHRGQYSFVLTDTSTNLNSLSGLEIEMFDNVSEKRAPVKSISGGESFEASLALALGLSDVVSSHAAQKDIDAIFVDEGFGSLEGKNDLDACIGVLVDLAGDKRQVGVISHIKELQNQAWPQIKVTYSEDSGSSVEIL